MKFRTLLELNPGYIALDMGEITMRHLALARISLGLLLAIYAIGVQAATLPPVEPDQVGFSSDRLKRIDGFFDREIAQGRVPGAVVGIARDGKLVYLKAFGHRDRDRGLPMQIDTVFALASMTKVMTAVGVLSLTEQGKLPLFSRLTNYFPEFGSMKVAVQASDGSIHYEPQQRPIYIQDLLRHTSGLTYGGRPDTGGAVANLYPPGAALRTMNSSLEFIDTITKLPLVYQPGTVWEYGLSFDVLAAVVEKITGKTLGGHLMDVIWKPLEMSDTAFHIDPSKRDRVAQAFPLDPLTDIPQKIPMTDVKFECGRGCAFGTMVDFLRLGQMLINGGNLDGKQILSPYMVKLMTSNQLGPEIKNNVANVEPHRAGYGFGLGVAVRVADGLAAVPGSVGEYSWNGAYGTGFFADPKERLVVVFGTAAPGELRKYYREQVQDLVYGAMTR
jgi:CubicO group peptidase (beta-lactamase class C family)